MLKYLQGNSLPDMFMAVHQTAHLCNNPILSHQKDIKRLGRYLLHTKKEGFIFNQDVSKGLECYVDADFAGGWLREVGDNADNIMYANYPVYWHSSLQTEIALSTAEVDYTAFSSALREVLPLMTIKEEINEVLSLHIPKPKFFLQGQ